jgi:GT2 family glycosyltransferase
MAEPTVSIVVVSWRDRERVLACLAAIRAHVRLSHEVIVVDDGSGDGTPAAVREQFPEAVVVARRVNGGLVAGRNDGLKLAGGRYVLMLDSDTEVRPGAVETLVAVLDADASVGLVGPRLVGEGGELQLSCRRWPPLLIPFIRRGPYPRLVSDDPPVHRRHLMKDFDHASRRPVVWVSGAAQMWRRELAERLGPYDHRVSSYGGEDLDWCLRVWGAGLRVQYEPAATVMHAWQAVTRRNLYSRKSFRALRDWYYLQLKHRRLRRHPRLAEANA